MFLGSALFEGGVDHTRRTLLHILAAGTDPCCQSKVRHQLNGNIEDFRAIIRLMLHWRLVPDVIDKNGCMPLHFACRDLAEELLLHGADPNRIDGIGRSALHWAVLMGRMPTVTLLISHDANVNLKDGAGRTPLHYAVIDAPWQEFKIDIAQELLACEADPNQIDMQGRTALHYAISHRDDDPSHLCRLLLDKGASDHLRDSLGRLCMPYDSFVHRVTEFSTAKASAESIHRLRLRSRSRLKELEKEAYIRDSIPLLDSAPDTWFYNPVDPMRLLSLFPKLRIREGYVLKSYQRINTPSQGGTLHFDRIPDYIDEWVDFRPPDDITMTHREVMGQWVADPSERFEGTGHWGLVYAVPNDAALPAPSQCLTWPDNAGFKLKMARDTNDWEADAKYVRSVLSRAFQPKPALALNRFMQAVEGDRSPASYVSASIFAREASPFGVHPPFRYAPLDWGISWAMHYVLDRDPVDPDVVTSFEEWDAHLDPASWEWLRKPPKEWSPVFGIDNGVPFVVFHTLATDDCDSFGVFCHVDRYASSDYDFWTDTYLIGQVQGRMLTRSPHQA